MDRVAVRRSLWRAEARGLTGHQDSECPVGEGAVGRGKWGACGGCEDSERRDLGAPPELGGGVSHPQRPMGCPWGAGRAGKRAESGERLGAPARPLSGELRPWLARVLIRDPQVLARSQGPFPSAWSGGATCTHVAVNQGPPGPARPGPPPAAGLCGPDSCGPRTCHTARGPCDHLFRAAWRPRVTVLCVGGPPAPLRPRRGHVAAPRSRPPRAWGCGDFLVSSHHSPDSQEPDVDEPDAPRGPPRPWRPCALSAPGLPVAQ